MNGPERYRTVRRIGVGGMAEIFEAVAAGSGGFQRRVAIKRMQPEYAQEPHFASMFLDEARIASHLQHANIVAVLDYGISDGVPFQVLEYVDGRDLHRLRRQRPEPEAKLPAEIALHICTEIGHALAHAHAAVDGNGKNLGIVHRDVKPSNILVSWSGEVKLTDFGIAFARERTERTVVGKVKGTLNYMAPEQLMRAALDGRADLFALGCVLHELLLGRNPIEGSTLGSLLQGHEVDVDPALDEDLRQILIRALRASKVQRFASAEEMTSELGTALTRRLVRDAKSHLREWLAPLKSGPSNPPSSPWNEAAAFEIVVTAEGKRLQTQPYHATVLQRLPAPRRKRRLLRPAFAIAAGLVAGAVGAWQFLARPPQPTPHPPIATVPAPPPVVEAPRPVVVEAPPAPRPKSHASKRRTGRATVVPPPAVESPPAAAPAPAPPPALGTLSLQPTGEGTAKVIIDDQPSGNLPYDHSFSLKAGNHRVRLERLGQTLVKTEVSIEGDRTYVLPVNLEPR